MKKLQFKSMVFVSLLAMLASIAAAPMSGAVITLIEVRNDGGGNVIFVFRVSGGVSNSDLHNGWVQAQGGDGYGLHCNQVDEETIQCTTSRKAGGQNVIVTFGGSTFWAFVPEARGGTRGPTQYCYGLFEIEEMEEESYYWVEIGTHCQDEPAQYDDTWEYYIFLPDSEETECPADNSVNEDAYYHYCAN